LRIDRAGSLAIGPAGDAMRLARPRAYQVVDGRRVTVASRYVLAGRGLVRFALGRHDPARALVIDPVLVYSTYLGGSANEFGRAIAVDGAGNAYVAGDTASSDFPATPGSFQGTNAGGVLDAFVAKLNPSGNALMYATYLGGGGTDNAKGIAADAAGNAYVTGGTGSADFPTTVGAFQTSAANEGFNAFVTKLNASGSALLYSTYLGGASGQSDARAIALDSAGSAYVTGQTTGSGFPTTAGAFQMTYAGSLGDAFVTKLNPTGTALGYSSYLGGSTGGTSGQDAGNGIGVDSGGNAYVGGWTEATDFPTTPGAFQTAKAGGFDAFLTKLNPAGTALAYSTYLGGAADDLTGGGGANERGNPLAIDGTGNVFVTGRTESTNFPTANPIQPANAAATDPNDVFVTKLNSSGNGLVYSTYLGGGDSDMGIGIALDGEGAAYVTGRTSSVTPTGFPTADPLQGANAGGIDAFVTKLNPAGSALSYSTYLGGSDGDYGQGIAVDGQGDAYVIGVTNSPAQGTVPFPTVGPIQSSNAGGLDAFVAKLSVPRPAGAAPSRPPAPAPDVPAPPPACLSIPNVVRDQKLDVPGGRVILVTRQVDDPAAPLRVSVRSTGTARIRSASFTVNRHRVRRGTVPVALLRLGERVQRNQVTARVTLAGGRTVSLTQYMIIIKCSPPAPVCTRQPDGMSLRCTAATSLGGRRAQVTASRTASEVATGSATVRNGRYSVTLRSRVPLSPGLYFYKHVVTTQIRTHRVFSIRRIQVS
ncbi:MAG: hypothetical protein QOJ97_427, partial [Solirubrobacteraceae bacterium]|nr:hypothetical protein [Solirubrobacteraceae bacterium]